MAIGDKSETSGYPPDLKIINPGCRKHPHPNGVMGKTNILEYSVF